ncbi:MAG: AIPR family protein [Proteobacteria bacterium]|nr:AIPR family protein [Pseudomonadota bacterium]
MELEDYRKDFLESVKSRAAADGDLTQAAFVTVVSERLIEAEELQDFEPCYYPGSGIRDRRLKLRVDGYSYDDTDGSYNLIIADYRGNDDIETLTQTDATTQFTRLRSFLLEAVSGMLHPVLENSSPAHALAVKLYGHPDLITRFRLFLVTDAVLSARVKDWREESLNDKPIEFHIWDIARFHRVSESMTGRDELTVDFREFADDGVPCLEASQTDGEYKAYLCVMPGSILADLYDRFGSRLLENNVRSFLGIRGTKSVNSGIRNTILKQPTMFFAYNNGIAATASEAEVVYSGNSLYLAQAKDLQIVNGGQTTASLTNTRRKDKAALDGIFIQMKLSVIEPNRAEEVIPLISRFANSQNKVSDADFFSNHPFHIRIETHSRRIWAPAVDGAQHETHWFYERARGQFLNEQAKLSPSEKRRFLQQNPRSQLLTKTDLAKYENTWRGMPHIVSLGAQKNFKYFAEWIDEKWKASDVDFSEEYFKNIVAKAILWQYTERMISGQTWYQGGYRANIVAYTIAKLSNSIEVEGKGQALDLRAIWTKQQLSDAILKQLQLIAEAMSKVIVDPDRPVENVTEWCKNKLCFERAEKLQIPLLPGFYKELVDKDELRVAAKDGKSLQKTDKGISAQMEVLELGAVYWLQVKDWSESNKLLTPEETKLVALASRIPANIPNYYQSQRLLEIRQKIEMEGFMASS